MLPGAVSSCPSGTRLRAGPVGSPRPKERICPAPRYVGAVLLRPPRPGYAPGALGFESVSSLCVGAPALVRGTPEPCQWPCASCFLFPTAASWPVARDRLLLRLGTPLEETEAHRGGAAEWGRKRSVILRWIVVGDETGLVWGWGLRNRVSQLALSLGRKPGPLEWYLGGKCCPFAQRRVGLMETEVCSHSLGYFDT